MIGEEPLIALKSAVSDATTPLGNDPLVAVGAVIDFTLSQAANPGAAQSVMKIRRFTMSSLDKRKTLLRTEEG